MWLHNYNPPLPCFPGTEDNLALPSASPDLSNQPTSSAGQMGESSSRDDLLGLLGAVLLSAEHLHLPLRHKNTPSMGAGKRAALSRAPMRSEMPSTQVKVIQSYRANRNRLETGWHNS